MGVRKWFIIFLIALLFGYLIGVLELQVEAASFEQQPGVSLSPDKDAYTLDGGKLDWEWYEWGSEVWTGKESTLRLPEEGEHYYSNPVSGTVAVGKWMVRHTRGICLHNQYPEEFHGITFGKKRCFRNYYSGWFPYCADCGEVLIEAIFYMSEETAKGLKQIDISKAYYYKCPHCDNLEQACEGRTHACKELSANRYYVNYDANQGSGYMPKSVHMYNNATLYEGREVTPQTMLNLNTYTRRGYVFDGWNTKADGSGKEFAEGAEIYNLSTQEGGEVVLYAQWKKCNSVLRIDPAGGIYGGNKEPVNVEGSYGENFNLASKELITPNGFTIHFETMGGEKIPDMVGKMDLVEWQRSSPFYGIMENGYYEFGDKEGVIDCITAKYEEVAVVLPAARKEGFTFGGWYLDETCTKPVGGAGSRFLPGKDVTLYAGWVDLHLEAKDNYAVNGGMGAVDLSWSQQDKNDKVYEVYQRTDNTGWVQVSSASQKEISYKTSSNMGFVGKNTTYTVPFSGFYTLALYGAQGGDYLNRKGGKGGKVQATLYLDKGEVLTCIIGGQNGFLGGGVSSKYGCGGGYSEVSSNQKGILLIAGGGGGASITENGREGGSQAGITESREGEAGVCGGGGGYQGGYAGVAEVHMHNAECKHVHVGNFSVYGGCYTVPVICNETRFQKKEVSSTFYYGNICWEDGKWVDCFCVRCGSYECSGHRDYKYEYICERCGKGYGKEPASCTEQSSYGLGCGRNEAYVCGMEEGEIIRSSPAYGGSNYVNSEFCFQYTQEAGINSGNGSLYIASERIGMLDVQQIYGVEAKDMHAPDSIDVKSVEKTAVGEEEIRISFVKPKDNGTTYYHQVKSYSKSTNQWLCTSNQTVNTLVSGVAGYYYVWDQNANTQVGEAGNFLKQTDDSPFLTHYIAEEMQYLHIAPVDKAGNIGETVHISFSSKEVIYWPIHTEKIKVSPGANLVVASEGEHYYVKADGATPIEVAFEGELCGTAGANYQIDEMSFGVFVETLNADGKFTTVVPKQQTIVTGTFTYPMQQLQKRVSGDTSLQDDGYTVAKRYNRCRNVEIIQRFLIPAGCDGQKIRLTPQAAAKHGKNTIYSDSYEDLKNSIYLIADGKGPEIRGVESLSGIDYIDFSEEEERRVSLQAYDYGSGLGSFYVEIRNQENAMVVRHEDVTLSGKIEFLISKEDMVYNGEFAVIVYSADKVGNETVMSTKLLGVGLSALIERILEPKNEAFKCGESGILHIQTIGYVERVEVYFPQEFSEAGADYNQVFVYDNPSYVQNEMIEFMIPLTITDGPKVIQVKAYKSGTELEKVPQFLTIEIKGSVLDELRTRLR